MHNTPQASPLPPLISLFLLQPLHIQFGLTNHIGHLCIHGNRGGRAQRVCWTGRVGGRVRRACGEARQTAPQRLVHGLTLQQLRPERHRETLSLCYDDKTSKIQQCYCYCYLNSSISRMQFWIKLPISSFVSPAQRVICLA